MERPKSVPTFASSVWQTLWRKSRHSNKSSSSLCAGKISKLVQTCPKLAKIGIRTSLRQSYAQVKFPNLLKLVQTWYRIGIRTSLRQAYAQVFAQKNVFLQLNKYETAPKNFLLNQNLTCDCLLISLFLPKFD